MVNILCEYEIMNAIKRLAERIYWNPNSKPYLDYKVGDYIGTNLGKSKIVTMDRYHGVQVMEDGKLKSYSIRALNDFNDFKPNKYK